VRPKGLVELDRVEAHFASRCRRIVRVPWDPHVEAGGETALDQVKPVTCAAYLELTAAVAEGFSTVRGGRLLSASIARQRSFRDIKRS
jgi:hypothetical protein